MSNVLDKVQFSEDRKPKKKRAEEHKKKVKKHNKQRRQRARDRFKEEEAY